MIMDMSHQLHNQHAYLEMTTELSTPVSVVLWLVTAYLHRYYAMKIPFAPTSLPSSNSHSYKCECYAILFL